MFLCDLDEMANYTKLTASKGIAKQQFLSNLCCTFVNVFAAHLSCRALCRAMVMTGCDLCAVCKPFEIQSTVAAEIFEEFYQQVQFYACFNVKGSQLAKKKIKSFAY